MKTLRAATRIFLFFTLLTGILYPLAVTGLAQLAFSTQANGSLIVNDQKLVGSELIGQTFDSAIYFSSRPSAIEYRTMPSGGSNLGVTSAILKRRVEARTNRFLSMNGLSDNTIVPSEMQFASASGLDPHISLRSALLQVNRIVKARHLDSYQKQKLFRLIEQHTEKPQFYVLGQERVNMLMLNLSLDKVFD